MKVTFGILYYLLSGTRQASQLCASADAMPLSSVAEFQGGRAQPGVLYYTAAENGLLAFSVTRERAARSSSPHGWLSFAAGWRKTDICI